MLVVIALIIALGTAVAAWVTGEVVFAWVAVAAAGLVLALVIVRALRTRRTPAAQGEGEAEPEAAEPEPETETAEPEAEAEAEPVGTSPADADAEQPVPLSAAADDPAATRPAGGATATVVRESPATDEQTVLVQPGRRRYHRVGCEIIADRATDRIALADADDEGLSACTVCHTVSTGD